MKETSISKEILMLKNTSSNLKEQLNQVADLIKKESGLTVCFCQIIVKRWSFCAGEEMILSPAEKLAINDHWGMFIEEKPTDKDQLNEIVRALKVFLTPQEA